MRFGLPSLLGQSMILVEVQAEGEVPQNVLGQLTLLAQHAHKSIELLTKILRTL
jgi:hypothetical protein